MSDKNRYVKSVKLNGKPYTKGFITQQDIMDGGTLTFEMTSSPNKKRVFNGTDRPYSLSSKLIKHILSMKKLLILAITLCSSLFTVDAADKKDLVDYVNPLVGKPVENFSLDR